MGSLRHGALPQAGAKNETKNTRMSVAQQGVSKSDAKTVSNPSFQDNEALKAARLSAMTDLQREKAVSNDTMLNSSSTNNKILVANKILYPKNSIVKENFTVTNTKYPEMNEKAQNILTAPDFIGPNTIKETSKVRGLNSFDFAGFSYRTGKKNNARGSSEVTVKQNPATGETIGDLQNNEIKNEYNAFDAERKAILDNQKNN
tara:strand:+ start:269 stop:877 length:609 start_codon:yes stop_codon:yes gene_type:complete